MTEDTADRRQSWIKGALSLPNIIAAAAIFGAVVSWQRSQEARNEMQDYQIAELRKRVETAEGGYVRRDLYDMRLSNIDENLKAVNSKLDAITKAVR